jgi:hypothetical protein
MQQFETKRWILAGLTGATTFWLFQVLTGPSTIPQFIGQEIVSRGGYPEALSVPIGWGVHLGVSLSYSHLFALIMLIPFSSSSGIRVLIGMIAAILMGWITTLLTVPAITVTISMLSMQGFPASIPELNTTLGLPFWNHVLFFEIVWLIYTLIPTLRETAVTWPGERNEFF